MCYTASGVIKMKRNNKKVAVGMSQELYDVLKELAEESGRTVPGYIRWLLRAHVDGKDLNKSLDIQPKL